MHGVMVQLRVPHLEVHMFDNFTLKSKYALKTNTIQKTVNVLLSIH